MAKKITPAKKEAIFLAHGNNCYYCGCGLDESNFTVDHIIPRSKGGDNGLNNMVPCCRTCNTAKGSKILSQFRLSMAIKNSKYAGVITDLQAKKLMSLGVCLDGMPDYKFYFERVVK